MNEIKANDLKILSHALSAVHKSLLNFQKGIQEDLDGRKLTAYDVLHLSLNSSDFEWLRRLSAMIVQLDEGEDIAVLNEKPLEELNARQRSIRLDKKGVDPSALYQAAQRELRDLFLDEGKEANFKNRIELALKKDQGLWLELSSLKKLLG